MASRQGGGSLDHVRGIMLGEGNRDEQDALTEDVGLGQLSILGIPRGPLTSSQVFGEARYSDICGALLKLGVAHPLLEQPPGYCAGNGSRRTDQVLSAHTATQKGSEEFLDGRLTG